jgi:hypothetical protein
MTKQSTTDKVREAREKNKHAPAADIAKDLGVSRERVRQALVTLGLPTRVRESLPVGSSNTNRAKLLEFREKHELTQTAVAVKIAEATKRPCSLRIVQAWEAAPSLPSARACPNWVLEVLSAAYNNEVP